MSDRRIDITGLQVLAGVLATVTGAVAASYLGVAGTMIGAAVMSVASTAGSAVYKHYLGRTAGRLKELKEAAPLTAHKAAGRMKGAETHPISLRHEIAARPARAGEHAAGGPQRAVAGSGGESGRETGAISAGVGDRAAGGADGTPRRSRQWSLVLPGWLRGRPRWLLTGVATIGLFAGVVGGITLFELAAGKPLEAVVWHRGGSGTTVGGIVGNQPSHSAAPPSRTAKPSGRPSSPTPSGSATNSPAPSPTPSSGSPSPTSSGSPFPSPSSSSPSATP